MGWEVKISKMHLYSDTQNKIDTYRINICTYSYYIHFICFTITEHLYSSKYLCMSKIINDFCTGRKRRKNCNEIKFLYSYMK